MSVLNGAEFLPAAIDTILAQTEGDFEFIILDDGSTDAVPDLLASQTDPRIRLLRNARPGGLAAGLNQILREARADYIARMDGDDLAVPERFAIEADFLDAHPKIAAVGSAFTIYDNAQKRDTAIKRRAERPDEVRRLLGIASQLCHPSSMFRRSAALAIGGYRPRVGIAEDFDFWLRMAERYPLANLSAVLHRLRWHDSRVSNARLGQQIGFSKLVVMLAAERRLRGEDSLDALSDDQIHALFDGVVPEPPLGSPQQRARLRAEWERINYWHDPRTPEQGLLKRLRRWPADAAAWGILAALVKCRVRWLLRPVQFTSPESGTLRS